MIFTDADSKLSATTIAGILASQGFNAAFSYDKTLALKSDDALAKTKNKNFALLASKPFAGKSMGMSFRKAVLNAFNKRPDNSHGANIRFIVLSSSFREGIDLYDIKYVHIVDGILPMDLKQAIGRGTRFCGQRGLEFHATKGWPLHVYKYDGDIKLLPEAADAETFNQLWHEYLNIDDRRLAFAAELEDVMREVAVDKDLNKNIHNFVVSYDPLDTQNGGAVTRSTTRSQEKSVSSPNSAKSAKSTKTDPKKSAKSNVIPVPPKAITSYLEVQEYVNKHFSAFKYPVATMTNMCQESTNVPKMDAPKIEFTHSQDFMRHYFTPQNPLKGVLLNQSVGTGKCHAKNTPILMYDGSIKMVQDIMVGEQLMGDDSTPRNVITLAQGHDEMFDIIPNNGDTYSVNSEHIICLKQSGSNSEEVIEMEVRDFIKRSDCAKSTLRGYRVGVDFPASHVDVDPYLIGTQAHAGQNVPDRYKINSREVRLQVLNGFIDKQFVSTGNVHARTQTCAQDILFIARSLGYAAYEDQDSGTGKIIISKQESDQMYTIRVESAGNGDYYGFEIDGNSRYLLGDFTVTHNTCTAVATATSSFQRQGYTILYVTRHTLKADVWKNLVGKINCHTILDKPPKTTKPNMSVIGEEWLAPMSYKTFSNMLKGENKYYDELVAKNGEKDPLRKTLLIIDEAHKLYSGTATTSEQPDMGAFEEWIANSYKVSGKDSVRMMLMTGTPIINDGMELVKLLNLMREPKEKFSTNFNTFGKDFLTDDGTFRASEKKRFMDAIAGQISYLNRGNDGRYFAYPIMHHILVPIPTRPDGKVDVDRLGHNQRIIALRKSIKGVVKENKERRKDLKGEMKSVYQACVDAAKEKKTAHMQSVKSALEQKRSAIETCLQLKPKERKQCKENAKIKYDKIKNKPKPVKADCDDKKPTKELLSKTIPDEDGEKIEEFIIKKERLANEVTAMKEDLKIFAVERKELKERVGEIKETLYELRENMKSVKYDETKKSMALSKKKGAPAKAEIDKALRKAIKTGIDKFRHTIRAYMQEAKSAKAKYIHLRLKLRQLRGDISRTKLIDISQHTALAKCLKESKKNASNSTNE